MNKFDITYESKKRILVVDDDTDMTRLLKVILEKSGKFEVRTENDALNAVNAAHEFNPDVVLLDVIMPKMKGGQIAKKIKESKELMHSKIIFFSALLGKSDTGDTGKIVDGNMRLSKLVSANNVVTCIEDILDVR
ncbi:MAG: CheY-like chemotaxis protein [Gammaproteobacteria bacterium]|jgi:CheY-like chemotaxis protein